MDLIKNPILPGFNPDPSILRVNDDYYIATSTFEWFPGVNIYHSNDLKNWNLLKRPLERLSQLNMLGNPSSGGIWAPCLSYCNGKFYLIYTDVKSRTGIFKDNHNYLVTTDRVDGEWSDPIYLNSSGFDPSLFHDDDGKKWLVNMSWDHRNENKFEGILLQEFSEKEGKLIGEPKIIFKGTNLGLTEGPHLYKKDSYYYLIVAEGGTFLDHAVTIARSKNLFGTYEVDPQNPMLTSKDDCTLYLQKAGHASLVNTQNDEWYLVHLCGRPLPSRGRCTLGRETSIQKVYWTDDGWLRLEGGGNKPFSEVKSPKLKELVINKSNIVRDDFDNNFIDNSFYSLRIPLDEMMSLTDRKGFLRLKGGESLSSLHRQSLIARRQDHFIYQATTYLDFEPVNYKQMAGLICYYDSLNYYYLHITNHETYGKIIDILSCNNKKYSYILETPIELNSLNGCFLRVNVNYDKLQFYYSLDNNKWTKIGKRLDASILSDEYYEYIGMGTQFTGAFVGMCCQDMYNKTIFADFDFFEYKFG